MNIKKSHTKYSNKKQVTKKPVEESKDFVIKNVNRFDIICDEDEDNVETVETVEPVRKPEEIVKPVRKPKPEKQVVAPKIEPEVNIITETNVVTDPTTTDDGSQYVFTNKWDIWVHHINNPDWSLNSYEKIFTVGNISEFWKIINNFRNINNNMFRVFIMREGIKPIWEDENNRNGGECSFKISQQEVQPLWEDLTIRILNESLIKINLDINGISYNPRNGWIIIKIWNKNKANDISQMLDPIIAKKYPSVSIKYKITTPEYQL